MKFAGLFAVFLLLAAPATHAANVGFEQVNVADGSAKPLVVGIWYPTEAPQSPQPLGAVTQDVAPAAAPMGEHLALIVISHGTGGWYGEHEDTALALAHAGFVVAAVSHSGDTYNAQSQSAQIWTRSAHIHRLIDYMLAEWPAHARIDPKRVGMFGFSAGAFTALVTVGGTPDLTKVAPYCQAHPTAFECGVAKRSAPGLSASLASQPASLWVHDARVRAAVVAAPALGYTFGKAGLANITAPIQLWRAEKDHVLPGLAYAEAVRGDLPSAPEYHLVANADHFDFISPCTPALAKSVPTICAEQQGFDRTAFHAEFNREVVAFLQAKLD